MTNIMEVYTEFDGGEKYKGQRPEIARTFVEIKINNPITDFDTKKSLKELTKDFTAYINVNVVYNVVSDIHFLEDSWIIGFMAKYEISEKFLLEQSDAEKILKAIIETNFTQYYQNYL